MEERDFVGYGLNPPAVQWPNDAKIAVSVVVNYEEGSEYSLLDGDAHGETMGEVPSPVPVGERDLANESFFEYGSRVGVWRIMNILDEFNVKATFYCCALALERNPDVAREITARGHEVFGHGNRWEEYFRMSRDEEREAIRAPLSQLSEPRVSVRSAGTAATGRASTPANWWWRREASSTTVTPTMTTCPTTPTLTGRSGW